MSTHDQQIEQTEQIDLDLPANHRYLNVIGACVDAVLARVDGINDPQALSYAVQLAVHEACANIIDHAYEGFTNGRIQVTMTLQLACEPKRLVVDLLDTGCPFDPASIPSPNLEEPHEHGYGLYLMRKLMDEVAFGTCADGNCCHLLKYLV